jgi:hypothetical protein
MTLGWLLVSCKPCIPWVSSSESIPKTPIIPFKSRYCLPSCNPLCMDSLLPNAWPMVQSLSTRAIVHPWRVQCAYIHSLIILGCLLLCYLLSSMNPLPRYEVTMFLRVSTRVNSRLGEEPYQQTRYSISNSIAGHSQGTLWKLKYSNKIFSIDCCSIRSTSSFSDNWVPTRIIQNAWPAP